MIDVLIEVEEAIFEYRRMFGYKGFIVEYLECECGVKCYHQGRNIITLNLNDDGCILDKHYLDFRRGE